MRGGKGFPKNTRMLSSLGLPCFGNMVLRSDARPSTLSSSAPWRTSRSCELPVGRSHLRVLFVFDPARRAVLLVGGNKAGQWQSWYRRAIPAAERLYAEHVERMRKEGQ